MLRNVHTRAPDALANEFAPIAPRASRWVRVCSSAALGAITAGVSLVGLTACAPLATLSSLEALTPARSYTRMPGQPYGADERQRADVYVPARAALAGAPVLVFFHGDTRGGGGWRGGDRADYRFVASALAERGVIVVVPDHRLHPQVNFDGMLKDSAQAVAWALREAPGWGGDARRVYVGGHSGGAYNAAMIALDERWLAAAGTAPQQLAGLVGLAGPYNFGAGAGAATGTDGYREARAMFRWPLTTADSQPINHVGLENSPRRTLLIAPQSDAVVDPESNTEALAAALREVGADVSVQRHRALSHATTVAAFGWPLRHLAPVLDDVAGFLLETRVPAYRLTLAAPLWSPEASS